MKWHPNTKLTTYTVLSQKKPYCQSLISTYCYNQTKCQPLHFSSFGLFPFVKLFEIKIFFAYDVEVQKQADSKNNKKSVKTVWLFYIFRRIKSKYTVGYYQYGTIHEKCTERSHGGIGKITIHRISIFSKKSNFLLFTPIKIIL